VQWSFISTKEIKIIGCTKICISLKKKKNASRNIIFKDAFYTSRGITDSCFVSVVSLAMHTLIQQHCQNGRNPYMFYNRRKGVVNVSTSNNIETISTRLKGCS